jgi:hypothetical protein
MSSLKVFKPKRPLQLVEMKLSLELLPCNVDVTGHCSQVPWVHKEQTQIDRIG